MPRTRRALVISLGAALLGAVPAPAAHAIGTPVYRLSVDRLGSVAPDGTVTLSGAYQCSGGNAGEPVFVATNIRQTSQNVRSIGGTTAVCDGQVHHWRNTGRPEDPAIQPGGAKVEATLMRMRRGAMGLPLPTFLAGRTQDVMLLRR
ncbi:MULTISPECIES: DUF6299 family protein [Streptomyces]|uniref:DUF6299 domain-containing protein n=1 Tax=Streptomyces morookaense TaxID=1970 RepID=A0A7Y7B510_STRMO|nr:MULTISPECIES: DUF6299 family protein [Streptomyces]MCC2278422.1 DUF6299 family protein [Streptomyces sp. ET3-23]NVK79092.1 hypothetical protein [Streptomyces morookaense]GHF10265.1 hypothetical protein GCM10010359_09750 [Streptomyces morookaense]